MTVLTEHDVRAAFAAVLADIAPEADLDSVRPDEDIRRAFDLDSMDLLNLVVGLDQRLGVAIPEEDYPHMTTVQGAVTYLMERAGS